MKNSFDEGAKQHVDMEERILFPFSKIKVPFLDELLEDLIREHRIMSFWYSRCLEEFDPDLLDYFARILETHVRKEERILFQNLQDEIAEHDWLDLELRLEDYT